ncbi:hypothetical protein [Streptomyces coeruleorubidus]
MADETADALATDAVARDQAGKPPFDAQETAICGQPCALVTPDAVTT